MSTNSSSSSSTFSTVSWGAFCEHGLPCDVLTSRTAANPGRLFFRCQLRKSDDCNYFAWVDSRTPLFYCRNQCDLIRKVEREHLEKQLKLKDEQASILVDKIQMKEEECEKIKAKLEEAIKDLNFYKKCVLFTIVAALFFMVAKLRVDG